jgi:Flp pilus assembly pilin Flp
MWRDDSGQGVLEYGLIIGLTAMVAIGALLVLGNDSDMTLARAAHALTTDPTATSATTPITAAKPAH